MKIAGRYLSDIASKAAMNPYASAAALGGLAAGGATLGNLISGEAAQEGPGRVALEALGAGGLGAAYGATLPGRLSMIRGLRRAGAENLQRQGAGRRAGYDSGSGATYMAEGANPQAKELRDEYMRNSKRIALGTATGTGLVTLAAGGLGGMLGGGIANAGNLVGIPGLAQNQAMQMSIDPESYGSSNSPGARYKAPTMQYM